MSRRSHQSRSLAFYRSLGFEARADFPWGDGHRWIEVYPPGTSTGLALVPAGPDPVGVRTGIILNTPDIDAAYEFMKQIGVDVDAEGLLGEGSHPGVLEAEEAVGHDLGEAIKQKSYAPDIDRVLAAASKGAHTKLMEMLSPLGPEIQKILQQITAMQPPPPDPATS